MAAAAGLFAAVAPMLTWFELVVAANGVEATASTTGWGSTDLDTPSSVTDAVSSAWDGWALAQIPDGAIASLLAVVLAVAGVRLATGVGARAGRRAPQAAAVTGLGVIGLVWMAVSWFSANRMVASTLDMVEGMSGASDGAFDDLLTLAPGSGFMVCTVAFFVATLCGVAALWSTSSGDARPLGPEPVARSLLPEGYVLPPEPVGAAPSHPTPAPSSPPPPPPPGGWL